ncbi:MAG: Lrp/AsnC family transcriptional regulator [Halobacteria archaeon]
MAETLDDLDIRVIRELQVDARRSYREIGEKLGVAEGTVYNRINKLIRLEVIKKFIPDIDFSKLGYDLMAVIGLAVDGKYLREVEIKIAGEKNVSAVYDVTGEYDAIIVGKFRSRGELDRFVKKLLSTPHVKRTYTMLVLNVVKETHGVEI